MKKLRFAAILMAAAMLFGCGKPQPRTPNEPEETKATASKDLISADEAVKKAYDEFKNSAEGAVSEYISGFSASGEAVASADNGIPVFDVTVPAGSLWFFARIDSQSGAVLKTERGYNFDDPITGASYTEDDAADFALWYLGLKRGDVENLTSRRNEDAPTFFVVEFDSEGEHEICWVDADSLALQRSSSDIGVNRADELALEHILRNIPEESKADFSALILGGNIDGRTRASRGAPRDRVYEITLSVGGYTYSYEIDGETEEILKAECEPDESHEGETVGGFDSETVSLETPDLENVLYGAEKSAEE